MDWYGTVFEVIDMRSFSNLWFWIALAVVWSSASHWVIGVPFDMVSRARRLSLAVEKTDGADEEQVRRAGLANADLEDLVRINTNRLLFIIDEAGLWVVALGSAFLSGLALLGFVYRVELAQAVFLLAFPMSFVMMLSVSTSRRIQNGEATGAALWRRLRIHRTITQAIGMVSIFITALWGMFQNLSSLML